MEENDTSNLTLNYTTYGSVDMEEFNNSNCSSFTLTLIVIEGVCLGVSVCGLVGNGVVIWFLGFHMKQNPFTVYILNLAVADFSLSLLFFLILVPFLISVASCTHSRLFSVYYEFEIVLGFLCHVFDLSSLGLLTALSVERCVSVLFPIWYRCHRPKHLSGIVSAALWALAAVFVSLLYFNYTVSQDYEKVLAGLVLAFSAICSLLMLISNLLLFLKLRCGSQRRHPGKLFIVILLNVIVYFAFGIPLNVDVFLHLPSRSSLFPQTVIPELLALLNSSLNPVIYVLVGSWRQRRFQHSIQFALRRVFEEKAASEEGSHVPGDTVVEVTSL